MDTYLNDVTVFLTFLLLLPTYISPLFPIIRHYFSSIFYPFLFKKMVTSFMDDPRILPKN